MNLITKKNMVPTETQYPKSVEEFLTWCEAQHKKLNDKISAGNCPQLEDLYVKRESDGDLLAVPEEFIKSICDAGPNTDLRQANDRMKGLYVFHECVANGQYVKHYVGISRNVIRRLRQHGWGKLHNEATFAYLMAKTKGTHSGSRDSVTKNTLSDQQEILRELQVAILLVPNDYDLYLLEVYLAGQWKTPWNSFRTH